MEMDMSFSAALEAVKKGKKIARKGWNSKDKFVYYQSESVINPKDERNDVLKSIRIHPHLELRTVDGSLRLGWVASQSDMLSDDWYVVD
jgi:CRISPR/Cas system CSM-associated protein Csm5 (group 7 of RAMP superfamily)